MHAACVVEQLVKELLCPNKGLLVVKLSRSLVGVVVQPASSYYSKNIANEMQMECAWDASDDSN